MSSRWTGFFVWALVAACTAFWGIKIFAATRPLPAGVQTPPVAVAAAGPMPRLFGAVDVPDEEVDAPPADSERFQLVGVIAPGSGSANGQAIVTIDGQPAHAWRVGATVDGNTRLLAVARRTADFGPSGGPAAFTLTLPEPAAAETGTLPQAVSQPFNGAAQPARPGGGTPPQIPGTLRSGAPLSRFNGREGMPGMPARPNMIPSNAVPPGRSPATPGQAQVQLQQDQQTDGGQKDDE